MTDNQQRYKFTVNGQEVFTIRQHATGAQLLVDAGFEPADDFILIQRLQKGSRIVAGNERPESDLGFLDFYAFGSGVVYMLTVDSIGIYWGEPAIAVETVRLIADVKPDEDLVRKGDAEPSDVSVIEGKIDLKGAGIEHLRTRKRHHEPETFVFYVDGIEYKTDQPSLTGAQIFAMISGWNHENALMLESDSDGPDALIRETDIVKFKGRKYPARFMIVPPATFGVK